MVVLGAGGHARVVADVLRLTGRYEIAGYLDEVNPDRWGSEFCGNKIIGGLDQLSALRSRGVRRAFVAVGDCAARLRLALAAEETGLDCPVLRHPNSVVASDVDPGRGSLLVAGAIINAGSRIGAHVIVNTAATVDHDCTIGDGAHVCPGVHLAGHVVVGHSAWIGIGAIVLNGVRIGAGSTIGAGSVVIRDVPEGVVAFGNPARVVRSARDPKHAHR
jgi:UDP-N-acetylbacillosamine N-acetyltransferase